jgi:hypothetical protein
MTLRTELYLEQAKRWPRQGCHILAHFDEQSIIVYQAYRPSIARFVSEHGQFGGDFSFSRMSWIKPNFLWMIYRSGWGTKEGQEMTLGLRLRRPFFDSLLAQAVHSTYRAGHPEMNGSMLWPVPWSACNGTRTTIRLEPGWSGVHSSSVWEATC